MVKTKLPTDIEHFDAIDLERHLLREENAKIKLAAAQAAAETIVKEANEFRDKFKKKYSVGEKDQVNIEQRKIIRPK